MRSLLFVIGLLPAALPGGLAAQQLHEAGIRLRLDPEMREAPRAGAGQGPVFVRADAVTSRVGRDTTLAGNAEVRREGTVVQADRMTYYQIDEEVIAIGNVRIARNGQVFTGPQLQLRLDSGTGVFESPRFTLPSVGGRGSAARVEFLGPERVTMTDAVYTSCRPDNMDWYLQAESLTIDETGDQGLGSSARLVFLGVPILAAPVFAFPLGPDRRSGVLPPTVSLTSRTGAEFRLPYYWNIAPNRDLTLAPMLMARRGLQLGAHYRYLEPAYSGETIGEYTFGDQLTNTDRWLLDSRQGVANLGGWSGGWHVRRISDDNYFVDFSRSIIGSAERSLPAHLYAGRSFGNWHFQASALQYQNILDARLAPAYDRLPQLQLSTLQRDRLGFDLALHSEATWFRRDLPNSAEGARMVVNTSASYPIERPGWFVAPRLSVNAASYRLDFNPRGDNDIDRVVPIASLDAGLVMERPLSIGGRRMLQTLEPRLFYVYAPYREQDQIPIFDSAINTINYATLFSDRIFTGNDRIANANQLTPGVVSRLIDPETGAETLRLGIAQRFYFDEQRVTIPGAPIRTDPRSDVLVAASGELGGGHGFDAGVQFSLRESRVPQLDVAWRWWPSQARVLNLAARYRSLDYAQIDASWRYPVSRRWSTVGRLNYSVLREQLVPGTGQVRQVSPQLLEAVGGFEYTADCWTTRFVLQSFVTADAQRTNAVFVQLELAGLARIGLDPLDILTRNIPGYRVTDTRRPTPSRFYGYE
jgi:LPS-assembly protein